MPELPEAETVAAQLTSKVVGKLISSAKIYNTKIVDREIANISSRIVGVERRGKAIILKLEPEQYLLVRLGMTGYFRYFPLQGSDPYRVSSFLLDDSSILQYCEVRKFGSMRLINKEQLQQFYASLGPEPFNHAFTLALFRKQAAKHKNANIKTALMDQHFVAGLGNIYAQEVLYVAKVDPRRKIGTLTAAELMKIHAAIKEVLQKAVEHKGSTVNSYMHIEGIGDYQNYLQIYRRPRCQKDHATTRIMLGGRSSYYCQRCQE